MYSGLMSCETSLASTLSRTPKVTWHRLQDAAAIWSEEAFVSSCGDPQHRRFIFPGYLPSAVPSRLW